MGFADYLRQNTATPKEVEERKIRDKLHLVISDIKDYSEKGSRMGKRCLKGYIEYSQLDVGNDSHYAYTFIDELPDLNRKKAWNTDLGGITVDVIADFLKQWCTAEGFNYNIKIVKKPLWKTKWQWSFWSGNKLYSYTCGEEKTVFMEINW